MVNTTEETKEQELLRDLASSIKALERSSNENRRMWQNEVNTRLEALALYIRKGVTPSTYTDERAAQVEESGLEKLYIAGGTY